MKMTYLQTRLALKVFISSNRIVLSLCLSRSLSNICSMNSCSFFALPKSEFPIKQKTARKKRTVYILINQSLIVRSLAQVGTFPRLGVAAASQILCISTALNKRKFAIFYFTDKTLLGFQENVNIFLKISLQSLPL